MCGCMWDLRRCVTLCCVCSVSHMYYYTCTVLFVLYIYVGLYVGPSPVCDAVLTCCVCSVSHIYRYICVCIIIYVLLLYIYVWLYVGPSPVCDAVSCVHCVLIVCTQCFSCYTRVLYSHDGMAIGTAGVHCCVRSGATVSPSVGYAYQFNV